MKSPLSIILSRLLKYNSIKVDENELEFQLLSHPTYPSLHALTGVLSHFNIDNLAMEVPKDIDTFGKLPAAFIAFLKTKNDETFVLVEKRKEKVILFYDSKTKVEMPTDEFLMLWAGIVLVVEKDEGQPEARITKKQFFNKVIQYFIIALLTVFLIIKTSIFQFLHISLSFIGLAMSFVIAKHELGINSFIANKFCSGVSERFDCNKVINSKAANFWGLFNFSDVGIVYFSSLTLLWIFTSKGGYSFINIILITFLALPFTIFSVLYQYFIVKKWCTLCLSVIAILWLQALSFLTLRYEFASLSFNLMEFGLIIFPILVSVIIWRFLLLKLKKEKELSELKIEHLKFKRNYEIFKGLISKSKAYNYQIKNIQEIRLGNLNSTFNITLITNPLCGYCKETHQIIKDILHSFYKNLQVTVRFNVSLQNNSTDTKIALRLLNLFRTDGLEKCLVAMDEIYNQLGAKDWLKKWGEPEKGKYMQVIKSQKQWCTDNSINFTPEILINGRSFPKEYNRSDIKYFIEDLMEEFDGVNEKNEF